MEQTAEQIAADLNAKLAAGGFVQVTTYGRSTVYEAKHAGYFKSIRGDLHVRRGKRWDCLSIGGRLLVGVRTGRFA